MNILSLPVPILERVADHLITSNDDAKQLLLNHPLQPFLLQKKHQLVAKIGSHKYLDTYIGLGLTRVLVIGLSVSAGFVERLLAAFPHLTQLRFSHCDFACQIHHYPPTLSHLSFEYCTGQEHLHNLPPTLLTLSLTGCLLRSTLIDHLPGGLHSLQLRKMFYFDSGLITAIRALPALHALDLSGTEWLCPDHIHALLNNLPTLRSLTLYDCPQLTSKLLDTLNRRTLRILHNCKLKDDTEEAVREYLISLIS